MEKFSIKDLMLANELCFGEQFRAFVQKNWPDYWAAIEMEFKAHNNNFLEWLFKRSRAWARINENAVDEFIKLLIKKHL